MDAPTRGAGAGVVRLWPRCADDRGRARAFNARTLRLAARRAGIDARTWKAGAAPFRVAVERQLFFVVGIICALAIVALALRTHVPDVPLLVIYTPMVIAVVLAAPALLAARVHRAQRRASLALGLCPACGYSICGIEPQADGCRVCPECGSAWKLDDPVSPPPS